MLEVPCRRLGNAAEDAALISLPRDLHVYFADVGRDFCLLRLEAVGEEDGRSMAAAVCLVRVAYLRGCRVIKGVK